MRNTRASVYTACQLGGWGVLTVANALLFLRGGVSPLLWVAVAVMGFLLTDLARRWLRPREWLRLRTAAIAGRAVATSLVLGLVQTLTVFLLSVFVFHLYTLEQASTVGFAFGEFQWSMVMGIWMALYLGIHAVGRARRAELERWKLEAAAQTAELRFLKAQLQPHFLFNCLNSVRALITEDPARAQEVITRLAGLLRCSLGTRTSETVPLERELQLVRDYLGLEAVRLEERLRVREEIEPAALEVSVPAMLIQTLVENAIKHGVAHLPEGGEVAISACVREGALHLEVANTPARASSPPPPGAEEGGVGLHNASERLLCGAGASLQLDVTQAAVTTARVRIPLPA
jgi:anti-sigma regulatory factor (Ser/Thr protein kinase)